MAGVLISRIQELSEENIQPRDEDADSRGSFATCVARGWELGAQPIKNHEIERAKHVAGCRFCFLQLRHASHNRSHLSTSLATSEQSMKTRSFFVLGAMIFSIAT